MSSIPRVFISYSHRDRKRADRLASLLLINGVQVWWDQWNLEVGHDIYSEVCKGIVQADYLALILSRASIQSHYVQEELSLAKQRELEERKTIILPLRFDKVELPLHLRKKKFADFSRFRQGFAEVMRLLAPSSAPSFVPAKVFDMLRLEIQSRGGSVATIPQRVSKGYAENRLMASCTFRFEESRPHNEKAPIRPVRIFLDLQSLRARVPLIVDLTRAPRAMIELIRRALVLPTSFAYNTVQYILLKADQPLEIDVPLEEQDVTEGAVLRLACFSFVVE